MRLFLIFVTETISKSDEGQPRPKYIFNKCGTIIYFFTLQRFGPSPSRNFRYSLVSCFYVSLFSDIGSQIRNRARVKRLQPSPTPITWSCPGWYIKTADGMKTDPCTQRRKAEKKPKKKWPVSEFNEFRPRLKSLKNRF